VFCTCSPHCLKCAILKVSCDILGGVSKAGSFFVK
jgi:hypothetical protein